VLMSFRIGTFLGHKGAVWQSRLSVDGTLAATASADFTAYVCLYVWRLLTMSSKVWDTQTGEALHTLSHAHIVRAVAFPPSPRPQILATGGYEKKLLVFDLSRATAGDLTAPNSADGATDAPSFEICPNTHQGPIKSIVWTPDPNILVTACEDKSLRWFDLRTRSMVGSVVLDGTIGSCELDLVAGSEPILSVAAGKAVYFFDAERPATLIRKIEVPFEAASVALNRTAGKFVVASSADTWLRVWDFAEEKEMGLSNFRGVSTC
jgi:serine-threonine kinase receptor-associated protein